MLQILVNLLLCKCCKRKSRVYASKTKDMETQTEVSIDIEIYSEDFESSTSPLPSPKKRISHMNSNVL